MIEKHSCRSGWGEFGLRAFSRSVIVQRHGETGIEVVSR